MNNNSIRRCQVHNEISDTYCEICKRMSCVSCEECQRHREMSVEEFIKKNKAHLKPDCFKRYKTVTNEASRVFTNTVACNVIEIPPLEEKVRDLQDTVTNSEEGRARDLNLITEATQHLRGIQLKVFTNSLKEATEEAIHALDVSDKIEAELSKYKTELESKKAELSKIKQKTKELTWKLEWLDTITRAEGDELGEETKLATLLCVVNEVINPSGMSPAIHEYKVFPSVCEVFDIKKAMKKKLVDVGKGIKVSKPVYLEPKLNVKDCVFTSISHKGVMATFINSFGDNFLLTDLVRGRQVEFKFESAANTGFFDDSMVMLIYRGIMGRCLVEDMFLKKDVAALERIGEIGVYPFADVSLLHSTRVLIFCAAPETMEYNVDTRVLREFDSGKKTYSFVPLTGINVGVRCMFIEYDGDKSTYSLNNDYSTSFVLERSARWSCVFIPSSSDPTNLKKGMKVYDDGVFCTDTAEKNELTTPFKYQRYYSVVRLYQDIFLVFDADIKKWCIVRIIVP